MPFDDAGVNDDIDDDKSDNSRGILINIKKVANELLKIMMYIGRTILISLT